MHELTHEKLTFCLKFIFELTIVQRDAASRGLQLDSKMFRLIHVSSSHAVSGNGQEDLVKILREYSDNNPDMRKIIDFCISKANTTGSV
jgi:hypothetical protein